MRILATTLLALAAISCVDGTDPSGLRMALTVDKTQVTRADSVRLTLTLTNLSPRARTVLAPESYGMCFHGFRVFDAAEREVSLAAYFCLAIVGPGPIELAPGASVTATDFWKPADSSLDGAAIPAGTYRLVGQYHAEQRVILSAPQEIALLP
jgi:hypothetical protein